jgi:hypothetical protein
VSPKSLEAQYIIRSQFRDGGLPERRLLAVRDCAVSDFIHQFI